MSSLCTGVCISGVVCDWSISRHKDSRSGESRGQDKRKVSERGQWGIVSCCETLQDQ